MNFRMLFIDDAIIIYDIDMEELSFLSFFFY